MSSEALRRLMMSREAGDGAGPPGGGDDNGENFVGQPFGFLRGMRERASMFEIRHRDGRIEAFTYGLLDRAEFDPGEGKITLYFGLRQVKLTGRNLNLEIRPHVTLFGSILRARVPWIAEADRPAAMAAGRDDVVIERVTVE